MDDKQSNETQVDLTSAKVAFARKILENQRRELFSYASCKGVDPNLFDTRAGVATIRAIQLCSVCAIRVEHLDSELATQESGLIVAGYSNRKLGNMRKAIAELGLPNIPQLDQVPTFLHLSFMLNLTASKKFIEQNKQWPSSGEEFELEPGTKITLANGQSFELVHPYKCQIGKWLTQVRENENYLRDLFLYELTDAGISFLGAGRETTLLKNAYAFWLNKNPEAKEFPLDTIVSLPKGSYLIDGRGRPEYLEETEDVYLGEYFAGKLKTLKNKDGNYKGVSVPLPAIEDKTGLGGLVNHVSESTSVEFNELTNANFEIFLKALRAWNAENKKSQFVTFGDSIKLRKSQIGKQLLQDLGLHSGKTLSRKTGNELVEIEIGSAAEKIRNGQIELTPGQISALENEGFIFDVDELLKAVNVAILEKWVRANPDSYVTRSQIAYPSVDSSSVVLPKGTAITYESGETIYLRAEFSKAPVNSYATLGKNRSYNSLGPNFIERLDTIGMIWEIDAFKRGALAKVGVTVPKPEDPDIEFETRGPGRTFPSRYIEIAAGSQLDTRTGVYLLKHPVIVDTSSRLVIINPTEIKQIKNQYSSELTVHSNSGPINNANGFKPAGIANHNRTSTLDTSSLR